MFVLLKKKGFGYPFLVQLIEYYFGYTFFAQIIKFCVIQK